jgi:AcrR family transcriptional regulator
MTQNDKKTLILKAAQYIFQKVGLNEVTMEDVAKAVGMGKSSLYYYFKSKDEIFTAVIEMEMDEMLLSTIKQMSKKTGLSEKLKTFSLIKFEMVPKRISMYLVVEPGMSAETVSQYKEFKNEIHQKYLQKEKMILQQLLVEAGKNKEIRNLNNSELEKSIYVFLLSIRGINREFIVHGNTEKAYKIIPAFCELYVRGLK